MANEYYTASGSPSTSAALASAPVRSEYTAIMAGFALLPTLAGNGSKAVVINAGGTAQTVTTGTLALAGNFSTVGAFSMALTATAATAVTLPTTGTLSTVAGAEELTNKTLTSSVGKGTWTASGTWTLPAYTLGGTVTLNGQTFSGNAIFGGTVAFGTVGKITSVGLTLGNIGTTVVADTGTITLPRGTSISWNANSGTQDQAILANASSELVFITGNATRATITSTGLNDTPIGTSTRNTGAFTTLFASGAFGCNGNAAQTKAVSGGTLAGVIAALVATGILSS